MHCPKLLLTLCIHLGFLLGMQVMEGQNRSYTYRLLTVDEGLPQSLISAVFQDREGFIWLCTEDGLVRYDGYEFKVFRQKPGRSSSIGGNFVNSIAEDKEGFLWVSLGYSGLNKFDKETEQFSSPVDFDKLPKELRSCFNLIILGIDNDLIWMICKDTGHYFAFNKLTHIFYAQYPADGLDIQPIVYKAQTNSLSIGTDVQFQISDNTYKKLREKLAQNYPDYFQKHQYLKAEDLLEDRFGNVWIRDRNGLVILSPSLFQTIPQNPLEKKLLHHENIRLVLEMNEQEILLGHTTHGFTHLQIDPFRKKIKTLDSTQSGWRAIRFDKENIWLGDDSKSSWMRNYNWASQSLSRLKLSNNPKDPEHISAIRSFGKDHRGNILIGAGNLWKYNITDNSLSIIIEPGPGCATINSINSIRVKGKEEIWLGTRNCGIIRAKQSGSTYQIIKRYTHDSQMRNSLSKNYVNCIYQENDSILWIGTYHGGLNKLNLNTEEFTHFQALENGLPNNTIYGILQDKKGRLWMSSNKGIFSFDPAKGKVIHTYDVHDGLQSNEFNSGAYHKGESGRFYFGGIKGLSYFHPDSMQANTLSPPPCIHQFLPQ